MAKSVRVEHIAYAEADRFAWRQSPGATLPTVGGGQPVVAQFRVGFGRLFPLYDESVRRSRETDYPYSTFSNTLQIPR